MVQDYSEEPLQLCRQISIVQEALEQVDDERLKGVCDVGLALLIIDPVQISLLVHLHRVADEVILDAKGLRLISSRQWRGKTAQLCAVGAVGPRSG